MKLLFVLAMTLSGLLLAGPRRLDEIVAAERLFASESPRLGQRQAFLNFFSSQCISFSPAPGNAVERLMKRPAETPPFPFILQWTPVNGDVSSAGDLGYTTGPYTLTTSEGKQSHGLYCSIWKKDQEWKVVADIGVSQSEALYPLNSAFERSATRTGGRFETAPSGIAESLDSRLAESVLKGNELRSLIELGTGDIRIYRDNERAVVGKSALAQLRSSQAKEISYTVTSTGIARSNDLAYSIGSYVAGSSKGYYLHLWKQVSRNNWKLAAEIRNLAT